MAAAGMTAASLVLLTACGGGGGDNGSDKIQTTQTSTPSATASASPAASATPAVKRPVITLPADAKNVFEDQHTGDPTRDTVLVDEAQGVTSVYAAIAEGKAHTPALEFYNSGKALGAAVDFIQGWVDKGETWTGTIRYFDRKVTMRSDGSAVVIYCSDESKAYIKNRKTGKVTYSAPSADGYVQYNERLVKSTQGVWQIDNVISDRGAKACQP
jgi:hypothetical protein